MLSLRQSSFPPPPPPETITAGWSVSGLSCQLIAECSSGPSDKVCQSTQIKLGSEWHRPAHQDTIALPTAGLSVVQGGPLAHSRPGLGADDGLLCLPDVWYIKYLIARFLMCVSAQQVAWFQAQIPGWKMKLPFESRDERGFAVHANGRSGVQWWAGARLNLQKVRTGCTLEALKLTLTVYGQQFSSSLGEMGLLLGAIDAAHLRCFR